MKEWKKRIREGGRERETSSLLFCACLACWLSMPTAVPAAWSQSLCACPVLIYLPSVLRMPTRCCCSSSLCHTRASYINYV